MARSVVDADTIVIAFGTVRFDEFLFAGHRTPHEHTTGFQPFKIENLAFGWENGCGS